MKEILDCLLFVPHFVYFFSFLYYFSTNHTIIMTERKRKSDDQKLGDVSKQRDRRQEAKQLYVEAVDLITKWVVDSECWQGC